MVRLLAACCALLLSGASLAAGDGGHAPAPRADIDLSNRASLQRGAAAYANYCVSCHSAKFMRYARIAEDLQLTEAQVLGSLAPATAKAGDVITIAMAADDAARWFGVAPPDLSLTARARGADWLYGYLKGFYADQQRPWGVNNAQFKDVSMPHVLAHLQGTQVLDGEGELHLVEAGELEPQEYDQFIRDLVGFLVYVGEPAKLQRYSLGTKVIFFLLVFTAAAWFLKREYWKQVH